MSCSKCHTEGTYLKSRVCFPQIKNLSLRTDPGFRRKVQLEHHTGTSCLENIPGLNMVDSFVIDPMHLIYLGVLKKLCVSLWLNGRPQCKLPYAKVLELSDILTQQGPNIPSEFNRKPRSFLESPRYNASEFRTFLLYTGPVVLKNILIIDKYENFLTLHVAITLLSSENFVRDENNLNYAEKLLVYFVETFISIYGQHNSSHNIHNLLHLTNDVRKLGPLESFSAFRFENYMQTLKSMVRTHRRPLQQIINRKAELNSVISKRNVGTTDEVTKKVIPLCVKTHCAGPMTPNKPLNSVESQFKKIQFHNYILTDKEPNNCCYLKNREIVILRNFALLKTGDIIIIGQKFLIKSNFYESPCVSSNLNIYFAQDELGPLESFSIKDVMTKAIKLSYRSGYLN